MAEKEYIEREAVIDTVGKWLFSVFGMKETDRAATVFQKLRSIPAADVVERASGIIGVIPAADVRPVVRGKWKERRFSEDVYGAECSVCHTTWDYGTNFCPNCGADMRNADD